ncbi:60Kd inner membrane protein-domain-containing protein [Morchella snyderi]|nr:60Kd inner membrane protein-domain-containing protein [Morchella snyderi]
MPPLPLSLPRALVPLARLARPRPALTHGHPHHPHRRRFHATPVRPLLEPALTATHSLFTSLHAATGLPWYALIPLTAVLLRALITTPTTIYSRQRAFRTLALQPLVAAWQHPLARSAKATTTTPQQWEAATRKALRQKRTEILRRHGCQRWKAFAAPLLQLPVWVAASVTLRGMTGRDGLPEWWRGKAAAAAAATASSDTAALDTAAGADADALDTATAAAAERLIPLEPSFGTEGALWFPDLLAADPLFVLPMAFSFLMFANIEMQSALHPPATRTQRVLTNTLRIVPLAALPLILDMPAALTLYWATSAAYSLVQNVVLAAVMPRPEEVVPCRPVNPYIVAGDAADVVVGAAEAEEAGKVGKVWKAGKAV